MVKYGSIDIAYVGEVLKNAHPNYRSFDVPVLMGKDLLIIPSPVNVRKPIYNKRLVDLWPTFGREILFHNVFTISDSSFFEKLFYQATSNIYF